MTAVENSILKTVKSKKTELLFLGLMLRMLKTGGRAAVIVPDGVFLEVLMLINKYVKNLLKNIS